jgi:polar amino acid transport system permease protein
MRLDWDWAFAWQTLPMLLRALRVTVSATVFGMSLAMVLGLGLALLRRSRSRWFSWPAAGFIEFVRSTPLLVQIYFLFYVAPAFGLSLSPFVTGVLALGVHYSTYLSEVYRAGIDGVPRGQWEAARALNFSPGRTFFAVVLPQAIPPIVPALGNYLVAMFKDTPLLSTITVLEILYVARDIGSQTFRYVEPLTLVGVLFLVVSLIAAFAVRTVERKLHVRTV